VPGRVHVWDVLTNPKRNNALCTPENCVLGAVFGWGLNGRNSHHRPVQVHGPRDESERGLLALDRLSDGQEGHIREQCTPIAAAWIWMHLGRVVQHAPKRLACRRDTLKQAKARLKHLNTPTRPQSNTPRVVQ